MSYATGLLVGPGPTDCATRAGQVVDCAPCGRCCAAGSLCPARWRQFQRTVLGSRAHKTIGCAGTMTAIRRRVRTAASTPVGKSSVTTRSATSSCGPTCCECTKSSRTVPPATALAVGLKVDVDALPPAVVEALQAGQVDLTNPAATVELLRLNAVVGVQGKVNNLGELTSVGITCALCHSSVDNSFTTGIGRRLDGWANTDLNVGAIVALSPALDDATKAEFNVGTRQVRSRHHAFDGTNIIPLNSPSLPIVIPPIYGLRGVGFETFTADGPIWYWNSYVGVGQMGGQGIFNDPASGCSSTRRPISSPRSWPRSWTIN